MCSLQNESKKSPTFVGDNKEQETRRSKETDVPGTKDKSFDWRGHAMCLLTRSHRLTTEAAPFHAPLPPTPSTNIAVFNVDTITNYQWNGDDIQIIFK